MRTYTSIYLQYYKILKYANIYFLQCKIKFPSKWQPIAIHERGSPWNPELCLFLIKWTFISKAFSRNSSSFFKEYTIQDVFTFKNRNHFHENF